MRAFDWRTGWGGAPARYGVQLVEDFLGQPPPASTDPLRALFRSETLANFNPRGSHFDGFVARLSECAGPPGANPLVTTSVTQPRTRLLKAIYSREQQLAIVHTLYRSSEDYFLSAVQRFGEHYRSDLLTPCWDKFRHMIGTWLMRFRDPASVDEREWIAIVLASPHGSSSQAPCVSIAT